MLHYTTDAHAPSRGNPSPQGDARSSVPPALFTWYPALAEKIPRHPFVITPTPVHRLNSTLFGEEVWIKRDDLSCQLYGGNKPRKLEFIIGAALARSARLLVTTGALGTNHGLATAILGRAAGLKTTLVLVDQPINDEVRTRVRLHAAWGANLVYGKSVVGTVLATIRALLFARIRGYRPYLVPTGGSYPIGNIGFVSAALELAEQIKAGDCPEPAEIYTPVGTGGTLAGLVVGLRLAGLETKVVGVLVTNIVPPTARSLAFAATKTLRYLHRHDTTLPDVKFGPEDFMFTTRQLGVGYGVPTKAAIDAVEIGRSSGVTLETTYSGKCFAEVLQRSRENGSSRRPVLFWHTYNNVDVLRSAPMPLTDVVIPRSLERHLHESRHVSQRDTV